MSSGWILLFIFMNNVHQQQDFELILQGEHGRGENHRTIWGYVDGGGENVTEEKNESEYWNKFTGANLTFSY